MMHTEDAEDAEYALAAKESGASPATAGTAWELAWSRMAEALRSQPWAICLSLLLVSRDGVASSGSSRRPATATALARAFLHREDPGRREGPLLELEPDSIALRLVARSTGLT